MLQPFAALQLHFSCKYLQCTIQNLFPNEKKPKLALHIKMIFFQSNADVKSVDHEGRTCISYARNANSQELVDLLLNNGCPDVNLFGSLPKRKNSISVSRKTDFFDKVTSSIL